MAKNLEDEDIGIGSIIWFIFLVIFFYFGIIYLAYKFIRWFFFGDKHPDIIYQRRRKFAQVFLFPGLNRFTTGDYFWGFFNLFLFFYFSSSIQRINETTIPIGIFLIYIMWINECFYVYAYFYKGLDKGKLLRRYWYIWSWRKDYEKISDPIIQDSNPSAKIVSEAQNPMPWETQENNRNDSFGVEYEKRTPFKIKEDISPNKRPFKEEFSDNQDKPKRGRRKKNNLSALDKLKGMIGLEEVKKEIETLINLQMINQERIQEGANVTNINLHSLFLGNPGTGKTEVARLMSEILHDIGYLEKGHLVEADRGSLVAGFLGQTALKTQNVVKEALGGVLFIDEAYNLLNDKEDTYGLEAINILLKLMEDYRDEFVVILAGYPDDMEKFLNSNPGLKSRIPNRIEFHDYSPEELLLIWKKNLEDLDYKYDEKLDPMLKGLFQKIQSYERKKFGNARMVRNLVEMTRKEHAARVAKSKKSKQMLNQIEKTDIEKAVLSLYKGKIEFEEKEVSLDDLMQELNKLIGLHSVKQSIQKLVKLTEVQKLRNKNSNLTQNNHMIFLGNPGTGKTTVARLLGKIFKSLGILTSGHLVEVSRSDLVSQYLGESAIKTKEQIEKAIGGILFIDEAYSLANDYGDKLDPYGKEVIDTLVKYMEDYRSDLIIIMAGYTKDMERLLSTNPGLNSRIRHRLYFEDYTPQELFQILQFFAKEEGYELFLEPEMLIQHIQIEKNKNSENFGNGRYVRNLLARAIENHAYRMSKELPKEELYRLRMEDFFH